jgi:hypothetical protein
LRGNREFVRENREFEPGVVQSDFRMTFSERDNYLTFAIDVASGLRGANRWLDEQFDAAVAEAEAVLMQSAAKPVP